MKLEGVRERKRERAGAGARIRKRGKKNLVKPSCRHRGIRVKHSQKNLTPLL